MGNRSGEPTFGTPAAGMTDPLSDSIATHSGRCGISGGFTAGKRPWALRFRSGGQLPVAVRGACWLIVDGETPVRIDGGLTMPDGRTPFVLASNPSVVPRDADKVLAEHRSPIVDLGGDQVVGIIRNAGTDRNERLLDGLPAVIHVPDAEEVGHPIDRIVRELSRRAPGFAHVTEHYAQALMVEVLRTALSSRDLPEARSLRLYADTELRPALALIYDRHAHPWRLADLARAASMSRSTFIRRFQALAGEPPLAYLHQWRMRLARTALRDTDVSIAVVAAESGFSSPSAFSHAFTRASGVSPSRYRVLHRDSAVRAAESPPAASLDLPVRQVTGSV